jgi:putative transposase
MRPYRRSQAEYDEIRRQVQELKDKKLIRDSQSPYAFPVSLVPKKDGGKRMVINYIPLNKVTIDDKQPHPHIQDVFDRIRNAKHFSVFDIAWEYWHLEMHPSSIEKTAFVTNSGHYEWLVLPMGLKNAPSLFQRIIQKTLAELLWNGVINYLDDFIVYTETFEQHIELLKKVFEKLRTANIKLK